LHTVRQILLLASTASRHEIQDQANPELNAGVGESICNPAGFATNHKRVLTSAGNRGADLEIRNIRVV
jgi:hypothetical protein